LIIASSDRGWLQPIWRQIAVVTVPVVAYVVADEFGGSGFIATFVGGLIFGRLLLASYPDIANFAEDLAEVVTMVAFMVFGGLILQPRIGDFTWEILLYGVLSLTLVRMLPVAISMIGTHLRPPTILYMGWFGPRGLASLIFATVVLEEVDIPGTELMATIVTLTVALSILLHGITAYAGSNRYADWYEQKEKDSDEMHESKDVDRIQQRRRIFRT
jgi:NhaP-type Na+/H+ or K+/H+ antiporter